MKIKLLVIGKTNKSYFLEAENEYIKRLAKYIAFEKIELPDIKNAKNLNENQLKTEEGKVFLSKIETTAVVVLLDEQGKELNSVKFSKWLNDEMVKGPKQIVFVIGGAYGFSSEMYNRANFKMSLSQMTFNHQMVRMIFIEQLYRAFTILNNEPYHHQ